MKQVVNEACSIAPTLKLAKFVDENEQHRKTHPKPNEKNYKTTTRKGE